MQRAAAASAVVTARLNRPSLPPVDTPATAATPRETGQRQHFLLERVVEGDAQSAVSVHLRHFSQKVRSMIRPPLEDIELPLMDHFMGKGTDELLSPIWGSCEQWRQKRK